MSPSPSLLAAPSTDLIANVFDALPLPAFVVDHDFHVVDFNWAGARLLDRVPFAVLRLRGGDRLECVHSVESAGGAAAPCEDCIVKNFVRQAFSQTESTRNTGRLRLTSEGRIDDVDFLITVAPIPDESEQLALLLLDDAGALSAVIHPQQSAVSPVSSSPGSKAPATAPGRKKDNS